MAVYRNILVSIPDSHVTIEKQKNGPALIKYVLEAPYNRKKGYAEPKRTTIGHQATGNLKMMNPTTQYKNIFPEKWREVSGEKVLPSVRKFGLFVSCQAINTTTGIKDMLDEVYGKDISDEIMDFSMYSVLFHSDTAQTFQRRMQDQVLYSKEPLDDSGYSRLFEHKMSRGQELLFKKKWALYCKEKEGVSEVWLCIDGSNDDCQSTGVDIAEKGHAKSGKNIDIVSFTYAVTTKGLPVTWDTYRGGLVDARAMKKVLDFLKECDIIVKGVILDRGYCDSKAVSYLLSQQLSYIIMIKGNPEGYEKVVETFGNKIKMNAEYLVPGTCLFGVQSPIKLFGKLNHTDYVTLFFDYQNGGGRVTALLNNLYQAMAKAREQAAAGEKPTIAKEFKNCITVSEGIVSLNTAGLQKAIDEKGLYGIVASEKMSPEDVHHLYTCRTSSEVQFKLVKSQLGYGTIRVYRTPGVRAKFEVAFIAAAIRYKMEQAAEGLERTTNQMILEVDKLEMQKLNDVYTYTHIENKRQLEFLKALGAKKAPALIDECVKFENDRQAGRVAAPRHRKPGPKKGSHRTKLDESGNEIRKKPGVQQGTKRPDVNADGTERKKPGVKAGTVRGKYNKDGSLRQKPGPKPGSHHGSAETAN